MVEPEFQVLEWDFTILWLQLLQHQKLIHSKTKNLTVCMQPLFNDKGIYYSIANEESPIIRTSYTIYIFYEHPIPYVYFYEHHKTEQKLFRNKASRLVFITRAVCHFSGE